MFLKRKLLNGDTSSCGDTQDTGDCPYKDCPGDCVVDGIHYQIGQVIPGGAECEICHCTNQGKYCEIDTHLVGEYPLDILLFEFRLAFFFTKPV